MKTSGRIVTQSTKQQERGHELEPVLIARYAKRNQHKKVVYADQFNVLLQKAGLQHFLKTEKDTLWSNATPWVAATPDSVVYTQDWLDGYRSSRREDCLPPRLLEIKTASSAEGWTAKNPPRVYQIQAQWQLIAFRSAVPECDRVDFEALLASDFHSTAYVMWDRPFAAEIFRACREFHLECERMIADGIVSPEPNEERENREPPTPFKGLSIQQDMIAEYIRIKIECDKLKEQEEELRENIAPMLVNKFLDVNGVRISAREKEGYIATAWKNYALALERELGDRQQTNKKDFHKPRTQTKAIISIGKP